MRTNIPGLLAIPLAIIALSSFAEEAYAQAWIVTYVEVQPAVAGKAGNDIAAYADAVRSAEDSNAAVAMQQQDRPNQFVIVEHWMDEASRDAWAAGAVATEFRATLDPVMISGYDARPYVSMNVERELVDEPGTVYVVTHVDIGSRPRETGINLVRDMVTESRDDTGALMVAALTWGVRENHMTVLEAWQGNADREAHVSTGDMRRFREELMPLIGSMYDERIYFALGD